MAVDKYKYKILEYVYFAKTSLNLDNKEKGSSTACSKCAVLLLTKLFHQVMYH